MCIRDRHKKGSPVWGTSFSFSPEITALICGTYCHLRELDDVHYSVTHPGSVCVPVSYTHLDVYKRQVRCLGANDLRVIFLHFYPNIIGPIIIQSTLRVGSSILVAATLNFLGLGAQPPIPEWGAMLNSARPYLWSAPYLALSLIHILHPDDI